MVGRLYLVVRKMGFNLVEFVFLTLIAVSNIFNAVSAEEELCRISPKDPYFLETQALVMECFTEKRFKNLTFTIGNSVAEDKYVWQNGTYAILRIPRITTVNVTEMNNAMIKCQDGNNNACIDNAYLQLDYYPQEAQNISCVVDNFETLTCTWDLGVDYKYSHFVNVKCQFLFNISTKYKIHETAEHWADCPNATKNSCFWGSHNYSNSLVILLNITVTNIKYNITRETLVTVQRDDVVKPGKVKKLSVYHTDNPSCVKLLWEPPYLFRNFTYKIEYSSICETVKGTAHHSCEGSWCSYTLCRLNPFTNYTLDIVSRYSPKWVERGFWSDVTTTVFMTDKTSQYQFMRVYKWDIENLHWGMNSDYEGSYPLVKLELAGGIGLSGSNESSKYSIFICNGSAVSIWPSRNPISTEGLYQYEHPYLTLYWLPLGPCELHSDDTRYLVSLPGTNRTLQSSEFRLETKLQLENVSLHSFNVSLYSQNSKGTAVGQHIMEIIDEKYGPLDSELIIEYIDNVTDCEEFFATIRISPQTQEQFMNISHTITWCQVGSGATSICMEPWHFLENVNEVATFPIDVINCNGTYTFGLITKGRHKDSGRQTWTDINIVNCIYPHNTVPTEALPNIHLSKVMLPNTLTVEWEPYPCDGLEPVGYIENYIVTYCETREPDTQETCDCVKHRQIVRVSNDRISYTIEDLEAHLPVCVWVSANTSAGVGPKNLNPLFHKVGQGENTLHPLLVIAPIFGGVALIILLVILFSRCKERLRKRLQELNLIEVRIDGQVAEEVPFLEPVDFEYPEGVKDNEIADDFYESDEETLYEAVDSGMEILDGYFKPREVDNMSDISVNSDLSQHDGAVVIKGEKFTVLDKGNFNNSNEYLAHDTKIICHKPMDKEESYDDDDDDDDDETSTNNSTVTVYDRQKESQGHATKSDEINNTCIPITNLLKNVKFDLNLTLITNDINNEKTLQKIVCDGEQTLPKEINDDDQTLPKAIYDAENEADIDENVSESELLLYDRFSEPSGEMGITINDKLTNLLRNYGANGDTISMTPCDIQTVLEADSDNLMKQSKSLLQKEDSIDAADNLFNKDNNVIDSLSNSRQARSKHNIATNTGDTFQCSTYNSGLKSDQFYSSNGVMDGYTDVLAVQDSNLMPSHLSLPSNCIPTSKPLYQINMSSNQISCQEDQSLPSSCTPDSKPQNQINMSFNHLSGQEDQDYTVMRSNNSQGLDSEDSSGAKHNDHEVMERNTIIRSNSSQGLDSGDSSGSDHNDNEAEENHEENKEVVAINGNAMTQNSSLTNLGTQNSKDSFNQELDLSKTKSGINPDFVFLESISNSDYVTVSEQDGTIPNKANATTDQAISNGDEIDSSDAEEFQEIIDLNPEILNQTQSEYVTTQNSPLINLEIPHDQGNSYPNFVVLKSSSNSDYVTVSAQDGRVSEIPNPIPGEATSNRNQIIDSNTADLQKTLVLNSKISDLTQSLDKTLVPDSDTAHSIISDIISEFVYDLIQELENPKVLRESNKEINCFPCENKDEIKINSRKKSDDIEGNIEEIVVDRFDKVTDDSSSKTDIDSRSSGSGSGTSSSTPSYVKTTFHNKKIHLKSNA